MTDVLFDPAEPTWRTGREPRKIVDAISSPFDWRYAWCRCGHHRASHPCYHADTETTCSTVDAVCERCRDGEPRFRVQLVGRHGSTYGLICAACKEDGDG